MEDWRLSDPDFTQFEPRTVQEAILRFRRMQRKGLSAWRYPECFVECARNLPAEEVAKFEKWLVNPNGEDKHANTVQEFQALPVYQRNRPVEDEKQDTLPEPSAKESVGEHL